LALEAVAQLREQLPSGCYLGVGTVTTPDHVRAAAAAGAQFVVSPNTDVRVIEMSVELGLTSIPGSGTASEALQARSAGADLVKLFPASTWTPGAVKDLLTALPDLPLVPTGGIGLSDALNWIRSGAVAVGLGGALLRGEPAESAGRIKDLLAQLAEEP
jgi:2-dehydro-3-deoxyphosphogluconate aldolase/(4S)-4-hydroxy-2-oxoglutarate aldolase